MNKTNNQFRKEQKQNGVNRAPLAPFVLSADVDAQGSFGKTNLNLNKENVNVASNETSVVVGEVTISLTGEVVSSYPPLACQETPPKTNNIQNQYVKIPFATIAKSTLQSVVGGGFPYVDSNKSIAKGSRKHDGKKKKKSKQSLMLRQQVRANVGAQMYSKKWKNV